jgi:putative tryptophan/tyrosine transport system substrate-binding protein
VGVNEPVASGIVAMVDRPTGNIISFSKYEASLEAKWFELLSEIAPGLKGLHSCSIPTPPPRRLNMAPT